MLNEDLLTGLSSIDHRHRYLLRSVTEPFKPRATVVDKPLALGIDKQGIQVRLYIANILQFLRAQLIDISDRHLFVGELLVEIQEFVG